MIDPVRVQLLSRSACLAATATLLLVYPALPAGSKFELVLNGAEHSAFSDAKFQRGAARNPNHHKVIEAFSTAFWDAYLKDNAAAKAWLGSSAARKLLEPGDQWQQK